MSKTSKTIQKMCVIAGITVLAASAVAAIPVDGQISIDRALNSPTLTVRYEGANAALVELRINGESLGTRSVQSSKSSGETNFTINLSELKDGDNEVEVRLFDRTGKIVGAEHTSISTDQTNYGPVYLKTPRVGATVSGPVEIDLGFGRPLKNVFVSFFVDNNFKKMTNYPPYSMVWDTTGEANGWHEVEAWAIDESSTTFKTRKTRIFVNNPGGRTDREGVTDLEPTRPKLRANTVDQPAGFKPIGSSDNGTVVPNELAPVTPASELGAPILNGNHAHVGTMSGMKRSPSGTVTLAGGRTMESVAPVSASGAPIPNRIHVRIGEMSGAKATPGSEASAAGVRNIAPTITIAPVASTNIAVAHNRSNRGYRVATAETNSGQISIVSHQSSAAAASTLRDVVAGSTLIRITKGQRLPNLSTFEVVYNSAIVDFPDVQPRVDDGIPMTPFRYLFEKAGGTVDWENMTKTVTASADGHVVSLQIGDKLAKVNQMQIRLETAPYIDRGRTVVPLSFIHDALNVDVDYDKETGHVLISSSK